MLKLLHLHWVVNRRMLWQLTPLWALWMYLVSRGGQEGQQIFVVFLTLCFSGTWMAIVALQGLTQGTESFLLALPARRTQVVTAAYFAPLIAAFLGFTLALLPVMVLQGRLDADIWSACLVCLGALALGLFLFLPLRFRLGAPKALTLMAILLVLFLAALALEEGIRHSVLDFADFVSTRLDNPGIWVATALPALALIGLASHALSRRAYARRSF